MPVVATMTLRQLASLRLMLRLQRVKAIKQGLLKFKEGRGSEAQVTFEVLQRQDEISGLDFGLMMLEARAFKDLDGSAAATLPVAFSEAHLELALQAARHHYGAEASYGGQAEQAQLLMAVHQDQEGVVMALKTATPIGDTLNVSQLMPKLRQ